MKIVKRLLIVLPLLALAASGTWVYNWWNKPSFASGLEQTTQGQNDVLGSQTTLQKWRTDYFTTLIPTNLQLKTSDQDTSKSIEGSYLLGNTEPQMDEQVGITIGRVGNGTLQETPAVKLRLNNPEVYAPTSVNYAPADSLVFTKVGSFEQSVFWQHGNRYAAVVVSGTSIDQTGMDQIAANIISNWQWLK